MPFYKSSLKASSFNFQWAVFNVSLLAVALNFLFSFILVNQLFVLFRWLRTIKKKNNLTNSQYWAYELDCCAIHSLWLRKFVSTNRIANHQNFCNILQRFENLVSYTFLYWVKEKIFCKCIGQSKYICWMYNNIICKRKIIW